MVAEIISTVERRRRWSAEEKLRIMTEALEPGVTMAAVAERNGVCRSQLYHWLRLARENRLPGVTISPPASPFVPVRIAPPETSASCQSQSPEPAPDRRSMMSPRGRRPATVEVVLTNGRIVKVDETIDAQALARLLAVLDRRSA
jgi:transposase